MKLNQIFQKPIDRPIDGVIKADSIQSLQLELEEYVITDEVAQRLESFLEGYNDYHGANGAWISGFFGSGKSHLLKMLSLVLENANVDGKPASNYFLEKLTDNPMLSGLIRKAVSIPSKSILFNIDQKADIISKEQFDAVLAVFMKVFDETCGYYGKQAYIAQFERDLDSRDLYQAFKLAYQKQAGKAWERGREQVLLESNNIANAYAEVTQGDVADAKGILDKYRKDYRVSIEDFAEKVQAYIKQQPANFRLNFFVDEVGQYIADNTKLMTNLQTIAESLATKCNGQAWLIVTSQSDINEVVGELTSKKANDFSKIQARFQYRLSLTSANVEEVIQKRLLSKTPEAESLLLKLYEQQSNNFKTLFSFSDDSRQYKQFRDANHFVQSYPFTSYQYALFQTSIENLSGHNAFQGKHSSVGERSMLGVFQDVVKNIGEQEVGQLATFDLMFEGIRSALLTTVTNSIIRADQHLENDYAKKILKALFLVKFVKEFKTTTRNICVLMRESFEQNPDELTDKVQTALNLLEQQTYIQRNGDLYEYLTDEEKAIETEIKNTEIEHQAISHQLSEVIFNQIVRNNKVRYLENNQDYSFTKKLDNKVHGREHELAIHFISPFDEQIEQPDVLKMRSLAARTDLFIVLPNDARLIQDLTMYLKTEKYVRLETKAASDDVTKRILMEKSASNQKRAAEIQQRLSNLIENATFLLDGTPIDITATEAQSRVFQGFSQLIALNYIHLRMLKGEPVTEGHIGTYLGLAKDSIFSAEVTVSEAENEIFSFVKGNQTKGVRTTVKQLIEHFEKRPYGWYYAAILCNLALLIARGKIEVRENGHLVKQADLEKTLRNTQAQAQIVLEPQFEYSPSQTRALKEFFNDYFDRSPIANEAKGLAQEILQNLVQQKDEIQALIMSYGKYPFIQNLKPIADTLAQFSQKPYDKLIESFKQIEEDFLDHKENTLDPVIKFIHGSQFSIIQNAQQFLNDQKANETYLDKDIQSALSQLLQDPRCYQGGLLQQIKEKHELLVQQLQQKLLETKQAAQKKVEQLQQKLQNMQDYKLLPEARQHDLDKPFKDIAAFIDAQHLIAVINDTLLQFEEKNYENVLHKLGEYTQQNRAKEPQAAQVVSPVAIESESISEKPAVVKTAEYVGIKNIDVLYEQAWLATDDDIDQYLSSLRHALREQVKQGKRIRI